MPTPATSAITQRTSTRTYPATSDQVRVIRAELSALLADCPRADDVILCASELATNAVIHSRSAQPGGAITVYTDIRPGDYVQIEVHDDGGPWTQPTRDADRPHGLDIVRSLASQQGTAETSTGRAVWAQLDWTAA
jgi:serine/threonine-protein kinase RsbW